MSIRILYCEGISRGCKKFYLLVNSNKHLNTCKSFRPIFVKVGMKLFATNVVYDLCVDYNVAKFIESKGMLEDALESTIDLD